MIHNAKTQQLFLEIMLHSAESFVRVQNIFKPYNFTSKLRPIAEFMSQHVDKYSKLPDLTQVEAVTGITLDDIGVVEQAKEEWFLDEFEKFTRRQEVELAISKSVVLLETDDYDPVETLIKTAVQISLTRDLGTDYFADPKARLEAIIANNGQIKTGWKDLDYKLYGGFNRGELQIFAGGSGSGKSLFMQNLAVNWLEQGSNGIFLTLELNEELCSQRIDSMITDMSTKNVMSHIDDVAMQLNMKRKKYGRLQVKYLPAQSTVNDIRAFVRELQIQNNLTYDFICIDYLDLLMPATAKVDPSDVFTKDKFVSEELRNLAKELNMVTVTASQLNRSAVDEPEIDHSHIAGGLSKIMTADNVFAIVTSISMKERGIYQLQLIKTRSSTGVGSKIELAFNVDTMRISDSTGTYDPTAGGSNASNFMNSIKNRTTVKDDDIPESKAKAQLNSKLKGLMNKTNAL